MRRAQAAGIKMSVMALLGVAGRGRSREHAIATGEVFSRMDPRFISCLCVTPVPGTPLYEEWEAGRFDLLEPEETLEELRLIIEHTHVTGVRVPSRTTPRTTCRSGAASRRIGRGSYRRSRPRSAARSR